MKVVINKCYGGFGLSPLGKKRLAELQGRKCFFFKRQFTSKNERYYLLTESEGIKNKNSLAFDVDDPAIINAGWDGHYISEPEYRADSNLVQVVEELGEQASGEHARLVVVDIPDDASWHIEEYDGIETIHENHSVWG